MLAVAFDFSVREAAVDTYIGKRANRLSNRTGLSGIEWKIVWIAMHSCGKTGHPNACAHSIIVVGRVPRTSHARFRQMTSHGLGASSFSRCAIFTGRLASLLRRLRDTALV